MIRNNITDGLGKSYKAEVTEDNALKVKTLDYLQYDGDIRFFFNETNGVDLSVNAAPSASIIENIHDGIDNVYWTASIISGIAGDFNFNSPDQNHTPGGSFSFEYDASEDGDIAQVLRPSGVLDLSSYDLLSGWFYVTEWSGIGTKQILFYGYNTGTGIVVGNSIDLADYINTNDLNTWQSFIIPLSDMGLENQSIDAIRTEMVDIGPGSTPNGYLDDFRFEGTLISSGPFEYFVRPEKGEECIVKGLNLTLVREYDSTITNGTMPGLSYNDLLGFSPINGILYRFTKNNQNVFSITFNSLIDFLDIPQVTITDMGYDGTYTFLKMKYTYTEPIILNYPSRDNISFRISDNFSSFSHFRISADCIIRQVF